MWSSGPDRVLVAFGDTSHPCGPAGGGGGGDRAGVAHSDDGSPTWRNTRGGRRRFQTLARAENLEHVLVHGTNGRRGSCYLARAR